MNIPENEVQQSRELSLLTYNVWRDNKQSNRDRLNAFITNSDADVICLQEVTKIFL